MRYTPIDEQYRVVLKVEQGGFTARLDGDLGDEQSTLYHSTRYFTLKEVSEVERSLVMFGAKFWWLTGYHDNKFGRRSRVSYLCFKEKMYPATLSSIG